MSAILPDFLPGKMTLERGTAGDYRELAQFHYVARRPATWADIWTIRYRQRDAAYNWDPISRPIAVGVLSFPVPSCRARERWFGRERCTREENLIFANGNIRTISRIIVHPQFRSLGLSTILVECLCNNCTTRYIEAIAMMARAHPFFDRAGMTRVEPARRDDPVYFVMDRIPRGGWAAGCATQRSSPSPLLSPEDRGEGTELARPM